MEHFLIADEVSVGVVEVFFHFVKGFFILLCLLSQLDGNICLVLVRSKDKGLNNGAVCGCIQVVVVDDAADTVRGESSQGLVEVEGEGGVASTGDGYLWEIMGDEAIWTRDHSGTSSVGRGLI